MESAALTSPQPDRHRHNDGRMSSKLTETDWDWLLPSYRPQIGHSGSDGDCGGTIISTQTHTLSSSSSPSPSPVVDIFRCRYSFTSSSHLIPSRPDNRTHRKRKKERKRLYRTHHATRSFHTHTHSLTVLDSGRHKGWKGEKGKRCSLNQTVFASSFKL